MKYSKQALETLARQKLKSWLTQEGRALIWVVVHLERHEASNSNVFTFRSQEHKPFSMQVTVRGES